MSPLNQFSCRWVVEAVRCGVEVRQGSVRAGREKQENETTCLRLRIAGRTHSHGRSTGRCPRGSPQHCESFQNGIFEPRDAVQPVDLTGDGVPETVVDEFRFACSSAASMYCGTGGCMLRAIVGDQTFSWLAKGWKVVDWTGDRIHLMQIHGANCGGRIPPLLRSRVWSDGGFASVRCTE